MLSRIATSGRGSFRRYSISKRSQSASGGARPNASSQTSSFGNSWLAKKRDLDAGTWGTRLACLVVLGASGWALYDQYRSVNTKSEMLTALEALEREALNSTTFMYDAQGHSRAIGVGFESLPDLISMRRRSFSGDVVTPVSEEVLAQYEARLVAALLNATEDSYENRWRALSMLHTLARSSASVRDRLRSSTDSLFLIMECGTQLSIESSPRHEWLIAADLLTVLLKGPEGTKFLTEQDVFVKKFLSKYAASKNPIAMIVHARFGEDWNQPAPTTTFNRATENNIIQQALSECLALDYTRTNVSGASLYSALGFALLGGVWGRLRWAMRLTRHGALNSHAWSWSAKKHIARPLALWFMADMLGTRLLTFASNDKFEFDQNTLNDISDIEARANVSGMSLTKTLQEFSHLLSSIPYSSNTSLASFLSVAQNCSFTLFSIWMITTRRYAFLPLAAAGVYNHYDQIKKIPQVDYIVGMGKMQAKEAKNYFHKNTSL